MYVDNHSTVTIFTTSVTYPVEKQVRFRRWGQYKLILLTIFVWPFAGELRSISVGEIPTEGLILCQSR
jgi:hypothetical protein